MNEIQQGDIPYAARHDLAELTSARELACLLGIRQAELLRVAAESPRMYSGLFPARKKKKDGCNRMVQEVTGPLIDLQSRIKSKLLDRVILPSYLMGGVGSTSGNKRGAIANAHHHRGCALLINEDVASYYSSIRPSLVQDVWSRFFGFRGPLPRLLTILTTHDGELPKGACTSPMLANLIFHDVEPTAVASLHRLGLNYTRLSDDISLSSRSRLSHEKMASVISLVIRMLAAKGLGISRKKHAITGRSGCMMVTGLVTNSKVSIPRQELQRIRAAIHQRAKYEPDAATAEELERIIGRISYVASVDPLAATKLRRQLHQRMEPDAIATLIGNLGRKRLDKN